MISLELLLASIMLYGLNLWIALGPDHRTQKPPPYDFKPRDLEPIDKAWAAKQKEMQRVELERRFPRALVVEYHRE